MIVSRESHAVWHETGGSAANAGVQLTEIGAGGVFTSTQFVAAIKPRGLGIYPPTTLVEIENTHNRAGGVVFPQDEAERICAAARERGIASFLDGARLWNAARRERPRRRRAGAARSTSSPSRSRKASAPPADRCWPGAATLDRRRRAAPPHARRRDAPGRHLRRRRAARARPSRRDGSPRITPTRAGSPNALAASAARPCSISPTRADQHRRLPPRRRRGRRRTVVAAGARSRRSGQRRSARAPCARSRTSTCRASSACTPPRCWSIASAHRPTDRGFTITSTGAQPVGRMPRTAAARRCPGTRRRWRSRR